MIKERLINVSQWDLKSLALQAKTSSASNEIFKLTSHARRKARYQMEADNLPLSPFGKGGDFSRAFSRLFFEPAAFQAVWFSYICMSF
ncbi:MAG TPA: hypothetical protein DDW94_05515 [Deltaproteobacteria bacterium]|nr:MAG: hypothetical protein A2Z79_04430 [Deltaproteobacteria bacterium GWA2_55_82]OGQ64171.1 MAG: hypothetical protein A3I81_10815 [Deltaproteobacteria bacterium RIFCSPLOWO2_02_FULL_55_12]OIJ74624.1 MAG: hypothetical protein A2V21_310340 [Deltaproteobacteria bacterium GWC2_55_46]HBG46432.1 hypothetical protein [Deltaproteobacteria bacterium]HCY10644.1 hypothetical protein [Deltaproteobacteria bacterium]